ncbi:Hypothetical predicted protein [Cloeon dipterum]|uniref:Voltage-dependent anion-selective channel protein 2 n=1 Tax=Cloeon dipterum TaxID=197152 RepID=A0A8S1CTF9_9INSE|nr:Hypothetical predicted protein [Cloeon dipterum]
MAPPTYGDLGKAARDVFGKGYHFGVLKLDVKTKTPTGIEFSSGGSHNVESGKVVGTLESKYKKSEYGMTFTEKWNTDNVVGLEWSVQDQLAKGLKLSLESSFAPQSGKKSAKAKTEYKHEILSSNFDVDLDTGAPVIHGASVFGYNGWLAGYQMSFDTAKSKLLKSNFAVAYECKDFALHTTVNDGNQFNGSIYQKVDSNLETGIQLSWAAGSASNTTFGIGCKYNLDKDASLRAKVNNSFQVGLGYQQKLRDGVTLTLSTLIDAKNFNQGSHKVGLGLELEA